MLNYFVFNAIKYLTLILFSFLFNILLLLLLLFCLFVGRTLTSSLHIRPAVRRKFYECTIVCKDEIKKKTYRITVQRAEKDRVPSKSKSSSTHIYVAYMFKFEQKPFAHTLHTVDNIFVVAAVDVFFSSLHCILSYFTRCFYVFVYYVWFVWTLVNNVVSI